MKKLLVVLAAMVMVIAMVGGAYADDGSNVTVSVFVADTCTEITDATAVTVNLDPLTHSNITNQGISANPSIYCTNGSTHAVSCSSDGTLTLPGNLDPINYTIAGCPASITGAGFSTATDIPLGISILGTAYLDAQAGLHSDVITVTVSY